LTAVSLYGPYVLQNAATATGTGTPFVIGGFGVANLSVSGTFTATITVQGQGADSNWFNIGVITTPGNYKYDVTAYNAIRANITSYTSGTVTVMGTAQALSVPQLMAGPPQLIDTIPYSAFTASQTLVKKYPQTLSRNARKRNIIIYSSLNQAFSSNPSYIMTESTAPISNGTWGAGAILNSNGGFNFTSITNAAGYGVFAASSADAVSPNGLSLSGDGFALALPMGATAPTSGNVYIYKQEVL
jgi:hypothetical protein